MLLIKKSVFDRKATQQWFSSHCTEISCMTYPLNNRFDGFGIWSIGRVQ